MEVELPTTNRIRVSMRAIFIVAISLIVAVDIYAAPPSKKLYDHRRVEEINAEDMRYLVGQSNKYNGSYWPPSSFNNHKTYCRTLFFDNLNTIDSETAAELHQNMTGKVIEKWPGYVFLGVTSIDNNVLEQLVANVTGKYFGNGGPYISVLVFNRLKKLSDSQVRILLEWRGNFLYLPHDIEISIEGENLIRTRFHTWEMDRLTEKRMVAYRKQLIS